MRIVMEITCAVVVTNFITWQIAWRWGVKNGTKWEQYRQKVKSQVPLVGRRTE